MSDARALPHRFAAPGAVGFLGYLAAVIVIFWSLDSAGWSLDRLVAAPPRLADFLSRAWPPSTDNLGSLAWKMVETLQIAIAGAAIGILVSLPVALLAARGVLAGRLVNTAVRVILGFIRAVPDLVWALVFVVAVGLGPLAGVLAIAL
ncbi:MAG: PhnE/PtxC family ABC transporter permease, partial [Rhodobacter sp.]